MAFVGRHMFRTTSQESVVSFYGVRRPCPIALANFSPKSKLNAFGRSKLAVAESCSISRLQESDLIIQMKSHSCGRANTSSTGSLFSRLRSSAGLEMTLHSKNKINVVAAGADKQDGNIVDLAEGNALCAPGFEKFSTHATDTCVKTVIDRDHPAEDIPQKNRTISEDCFTDDVSRTTRAIILAGGEASMALTKLKALASLPIVSNTHLIDFPISQCIKSGINKVYVLTQFNSYAVNSHIHQSYGYIGVGDLGSFVEVLASNQTCTNKEWCRGSADAVRQSFEEMMDENRGLTAATDYVILPGSSIHTVDLRKVMQFHREKNADITICCTNSSNSDYMKSQGILTVDQDFRVTFFEENPCLHHNSLLGIKAGELTSMGVYIFSREALLDLLNAENAEFVTHIGHHVIPRAIAKGMKVNAYQYNGLWYDIRTCKEYFSANINLLCAETESTGPLSDHSFPVPQNGLAPPRFIGKVKVHNSMIGSNTLLHDCTIGTSIIGNDLVVGQGTRVSNCIMGNAESIEYVHLGENRKFRRGIGRNVTLDNCIVEDNVWIGHDSTIVNANGLQEANCIEKGYIIQDGIVIILRNTIIPDGTKI